MAVLKFLHVAVQVLRRHLVVDALVAALEQCPKGFDAIGVRLLADIFADRVPHGLVVEGQAGVDLGIVGVDGRALLGVLHDKAFHRRLIDLIDHAGRDLTGFAVFRARDGCLVDCTTTGAEFLPRVLVALKPAKERLVGLDRAGKQQRLGLQGFPEPVQHEPSRLLRDAQLPVQAHRGNALDVGQVQVQANRAGAAGHLGVLHDGALADCEHGLLGAVAAAVRHALAPDAALDVERAVARAARSDGPADVFDSRPRLFLGVEHIRDFEQGHALAERFA